MWFSVTPSSVEPYPGWLDNLSSPVSIAGASGKGILRAYYGPGEAPKAYVPVDFSTNSLMVSAWRQAKYVEHNKEEFARQATTAVRYN